MQSWAQGCRAHESGGLAMLPGNRDPGMMPKKRQVLTPVLLAGHLSGCCGLPEHVVCVHAEWVCKDFHKLCIRHRCCHLCDTPHPTHRSPHSVASCAHSDALLHMRCWQHVCAQWPLTFFLPGSLFAACHTGLTALTVSTGDLTLMLHHADMLRTHMQLGLGGGKTGLGIRQTWTAVTGSSLGYRALLVGALPRVQSHAGSCNSIGAGVCIPATVHKVHPKLFLRAVNVKVCLIC